MKRSGIQGWFHLPATAACLPAIWNETFVRAVHEGGWWAVSVSQGLGCGSVVSENVSSWALSRIPQKGNRVAFFFFMSVSGAAILDSVVRVGEVQSLCLSALCCLYYPTVLLWLLAFWFTGFSFMSLFKLALFCDLPALCIAFGPSWLNFCPLYCYYFTKGCRIMNMEVFVLFILGGTERKYIRRHSQWSEGLFDSDPETQRLLGKNGLKRSKWLEMLSETHSGVPFFLERPWTKAHFGTITQKIMISLKDDKLQMVQLQYASVSARLRLVLRPGCIIRYINPQRKKHKEHVVSDGTQD